MNGLLLKTKGSQIINITYSRRVDQSRCSSHLHVPEHPKTFSVSFQDLKYKSVLFRQSELTCGIKFQKI